jgi:hypothetical protein
LAYLMYAPLITASVAIHGGPIVIRCSQST